MKNEEETSAYASNNYQALAHDVVSAAGGIEELERLLDDKVSVAVADLAKNTRRANPAETARLKKAIPALADGLRAARNLAENEFPGELTREAYETAQMLHMRQLIGNVAHKTEQFSGMFHELFTSSLLQLGIVIRDIQEFDPASLQAINPQLQKILSSFDQSATRLGLTKEVQFAEKSYRAGFFIRRANGEKEI